MSTYLKINHTEYACEAAERHRDSAWGGRATYTLTLAMSAQEAARLLPTGVKWSLVERAEGEDDYTRDMSAYSISGPLTDHRDGRVSIKMGEPTEDERLRPYIEQAASLLPDATAAECPQLFPRWDEHIGEAVIPGDRRSDEDADGVLRLYKVREGQGHTTQESWRPHLTPALWVVVDVEHAGTQDDPIPASRGMEYEYGKYYLDSEDGKTYLCERTGEAAGGKIVLQYLPHEVVGQYFTEVK